MKKKSVLIFVFILLVVCAVPVFSEAGSVNEKDSSFGALSLLPPLLAILLAFITKHVLLSLFIGILSGAIMLNGGNVFIAFLRTLDNYILGSLADSWNAGIIIFTLTIGGMVGIIGKTGGTKAIAESLSKRAKTSRSAQLMTSILGCCIFFDDLANTIIVGSTMKPLTDKMKISREKLAYIVDSTASPIAGMAVISTWVGYEIGLIADTFTNIGVETNFFTFFIRTIPFAFYNIFTLVIIFTLIAQSRDYGPMYNAEKRARLTGKLIADGSKPMTSEETETNLDKNIELRISNAVIPILVLVLTTFFGLWYSGWSLGEGSIAFSNIRDCFGNADTSVVLVWAATIASFVAGGIAIARKILNVGEVFDAWINGGKSLYMAAVLLVLSWSIGSIIKEVGTADYLIQVVSNRIPGLFLPIIVFVISCLVSFSTGTAWGTMAIIVPLAVPLACAYVPNDPTQSSLVLATISAVLSGGIFGDHCSPISDTTIISSMSAGCDHIDHVKTQIPYALTSASFAVFAYLLFGILNFALGYIIALAASVAGIILFIKLYGKKTDFESLQKAK